MGDKKIRKKSIALAAVCILSGALICGACGKQAEEINSKEDISDQTENEINKNNSNNKETETKENTSGQIENEINKTNSNNKETETKETTSDQTENKTEESDLNGLKNNIPQTKEERQKRLEDYANKHNLDEDGFKWLRWLDAESEFENSGTFLLDGFNEEERAAADLLEQASG